MIWPAAAFAAPPEMGASKYKNPELFRRFSSKADQLGSTVEHMIKSDFGFISFTAPCSPNRMVSVCSALTTTLMMMSDTFASSEGVLNATPPANAKFSATSNRTSQIFRS